MTSVRASSGASIAEHVGQLFVVGFEGRRPDDPGVQRLRRLAEAGDVGGAIFFRHNVESQTQVRSLIGEMKSWRCPHRLWLMVDQEGGSVQRLRPDQGFSAWPSQRTAGAGSIEDANALYAGLAAEISDLGFSANLAPVVDLHFDASPAIGRLDRSFGPDVDTVVAHAQQVVLAHRQRGVASALKHFPGHGSARADTHRGLTDVSSLHQPRELEPFARLISDGYADMVMTSHLVHRPMAGNSMPLTLSRPAIWDTLRQSMGFDGVVISDDLYMGALSEVAGGISEVVIGALASGHDLIIVSGNRAARGAGASGFADDAAGIIGDLRANVAEGLRLGRVDPTEVEASCQRVQRLSERFPERPR